MIREKTKQRDSDAAEMDRRELEMKHRLFELEKEMNLGKVEKERQLRHLEEDF